MTEGRTAPAKGENGEMKFEFMTSHRIIFERGAVQKIGTLAKGLGAKALIASGLFKEDTERLAGHLQAEGVGSVTVYVQGEPSIEGIEEGVALARREGCDLVIGFGGGSAMDTAKAVSVMLTNQGEILDYLEVIGKGRALENPSAPCIAVPTTSGTGAEVTKNAVLSSKAHKLKVSLRSPYMLPDLVLLDPETTVSVPPPVTASTGPSTSGTRRSARPRLCWRAPASARRTSSPSASPTSAKRR